MYNPLDYIYKYPHRTKQLLGISYDQFLQLVVQAKLQHEERRAAIEKTRDAGQRQGGWTEAETLPGSRGGFVLVLLATSAHI